MPGGHGNAMGMGNAGTSSAGYSFISTLINRMPYSYKVLQNAFEKNPKYQIFNDLIPHPDQRVRQQSVFQQTSGPAGGVKMIDSRYHDIVYADIDIDKMRRIQEYRRMAAYSELAECIDEIADEAIVRDNNGEIVKCFVLGDKEKIIVEAIQKEWKRFINVFDLEQRGWEMIRRFLAEGELFFENVISKHRPDYGIIGVVGMPTELVNPIYDNVQNQIINGYLLRKPILDPRRSVMNQQAEELVVLDKNQITYINSGMWNEDHTIRLPYIENSRRAYKQLSLVEDSIVIHRLVRAPERLVFKVDVGNMPTPKAEEYIRKLMQQYWSRKNFDPSQNRPTNVYDPQSMLDAYWFAKRGNSTGTDVTTLPPGQNLGALDDLNYFIKKLWRSLKVPQQRLDPANPFADGDQITREELRFARFIMRIQQQIAIGLKRAFITHLQLRGKKKEKDQEEASFWEKWKLRDHHLRIEFNTPTSFAVMREQQIFDLKKNNFTGLAATELMSQSFCQKYYLGLTDAQMAENREWLRKDASISWELQQIINNGPDFRNKLLAEPGEEGMEGMGGMGAGGSALPGGGSMPEMPPEFGPGPETGEAGAAGTEAGAPPAAGAGGAAPAAAAPPPTAAAPPAGKK